MSVGTLWRSRRRIVELGLAKALTLRQGDHVDEEQSVLRAAGGRGAAYCPGLLATPQLMPQSIAWTFFSLCRENGRPADDQNSKDFLQKTVIRTQRRRRERKLPLLAVLTPCLRRPDSLRF